mgnify:CR=1 FL=1
MQPSVYPFLLNMWIRRRLDETYLEGQVRRKHITEEEKMMILATPQIPEQQ